MSLLIFIFTTDSPAAEAELKPHNVIVRSSFKEEVNVPDIKQHQYSLFEPGKVREPFLPDFNFKVELLPDDFPQNTNIGWLTKLSPFLARFLRGDNGRLENGIYAYQQNNITLAETDLRPLLYRSADISETAILYLAWIKYKELLWDETINLAMQLLLSNEIEISKEAYYLTTLVHYKQKQFQKVITLSESLISRISFEKLDLKHVYIYLISLTKLGSWGQAKSVSDTVLQRPITHTKPFFELVALSGRIDYKNKDYASSFKRYQQAKSYNEHPAFQYEMIRRIAWLNYLNGNYELALTTLQDQKSLYSIEHAEELSFLQLACLTQLKKWSPVKALLNQFEERSIFRKYGSYLIRDRLQNPKESPELFDQVSTRKFEFPEMMFHIALLNGNLFFKQNRFKKAQDEYIRAMAIDNNSQDYWIAQNNLGLAYLKLNQYPFAEKVFLNLMKSAHGAPPDQLRYHLIYAQYQQSKTDPSWGAFSPIDFPSLKQEQLIELMLIKAGTLIRLNKLEAAKIVFRKIWLLTKQTDALEFIVKIHYDLQQFDKSVKLVREHPDHYSDTLVIYEVKSFLAMRKFNEAKEVIRRIPEDREPFIKLRLEVWTAVHDYRTIITFVSDILKQPLDREKRRFYYLNLGDAYFNLQQYKKSKNQFYRALGLTKESSLKSFILYNIALCSYYYDDQSSFFKEVKQLLDQKDVTSEVRYNLTILLAESYQKTENFAQADKSLEQYSLSYSYNLAGIHIKRIRLLFQNNYLKQCVKLSREGVKGENDYQRRDRIIMFGYCANAIQRQSEAIKIIQLEIQTDKRSYRKNELNFVLAQAYFQAENFNRSLVLSKSLLTKALTTKVRQDTQLLLTQNRLHLKHPQEAIIQLGDVNQYRITGQYIESLQLKSEIELALELYHKAYRTLLRLYYLPISSAFVQQTALLSLTEGFLKEK
ncbi:MAG: tetratricopeptide repeat protein, partial [SAR324 cluster bacterium]|nr:tetratricopeptide repeat protein [SAR324 cluster bacterium]